MSNKRRLVILLGAPGAGKGTQAERIAQKYDLKHLSTGDLLRAEVARDSELGRLAQSYMSKGALVADEIILKIVENYFKEHSNEGILLDGFPRTLRQAEGLTSFINNRDVVVISIDVDEEEIVKRLSNRRSCRNCNRVYNLLMPLYPSDGHCECGGELYQRDDDKPETIRKRLEVYRMETSPLIEFYRKLGILKSVKGEGSPDGVWIKVQDALK